MASVPRLCHVAADRGDDAAKPCFPAFAEHLTTATKSTLSCKCVSALFGRSRGRAIFTLSLGRDESDAFHEDVPDY